MNPEVIFWIVAGLLGLILCMAMMGASLWGERPDVVDILVEDDYVSSQIDTYKVVPLSADMSELTDADKNAVHYLQEAAKVIDPLFWRQYLLNNKEIYDSLVEARDYYNSRSDNEKYEQYTHLIEYYTINTGPYEVLVDYNPFIGPTNSVNFPAQRKSEAEYYPADITPEEWQTYISNLEKNNKTEEYNCALSSVSVIKRKDGGSGPDSLECHWYSEEYRDYLVPIHDYLLLAASFVSDEDEINKSMKKFLTERAQSCLDDSYIESDEAWVNVSQDSTFDITIGPYETYMDGFNGIKASFEAYIGITRRDDTKRVSTYSSYLNELQDHLPGDKSVYNQETAELKSQVKIIDLIYSSGEAKQASQTLAYNLPNIPTKNNQSRQVMLYNVQQAKFDNILTPIAKIINDVETDEEIYNIISFDTNFQHTISHEFAHALGPTKTVDGKNINEALGKYYSAYEEAKADVGAMWSVSYLAENQRPCDGNQEQGQGCGYAIQCKNSHFEGDNSVDYVSCDEYLEKFFNTFLGDIIRTLRFGVSEAHGQAVASYLNTFIEKGAITVDGTKLTCDVNLMIKGAEEIFGHLLTTEGKGDAQEAERWLTEEGVIKDKIQDILDKVNEGGVIPVDIRPEYKDY